MKEFNWKACTIQWKSKILVDNDCGLEPDSIELRCMHWLPWKHTTCFGMAPLLGSWRHRFKCDQSAIDDIRWKGGAHQSNSGFEYQSEWISLRLFSGWGGVGCAELWVCHEECFRRVFVQLHGEAISRYIARWPGSQHFLFSKHESTVSLPMACDVNIDQESDRNPRTNNRSNQPRRSRYTMLGWMQDPECALYSGGMQQDRWWILETNSTSTQWWF